MNDYGAFQQNFDSVVLSPSEDDTYEDRLRLPWQIPVFILVAAIVIGVALNHLYYNPALTMEGAINKYQMMLNDHSYQARCLAPDEYWKYLASTKGITFKEAKSTATYGYAWQLQNIKTYYGGAEVIVQIVESRDLTENERSSVGSLMQKLKINPSRVKQTQYLVLQVAFQTPEGIVGGNKEVYAIQIDGNWYLATWDKKLCFIFDSALPQ